MKHIAIDAAACTELSDSGANTGRSLPVAPNAPATVMARCWRMFRLRCDRRRQRRHLKALDDHLLADIGVTRDQARREANRWFFE